MMAHISGFGASIASSGDPFSIFSLLKTQLVLNVFDTLRLEIAPRLSETEISTQNGPKHSSFYKQKLIFLYF